MSFISSLSVTTPLRSSVLQLQTELTQAQTEVSTQTKADIGLSLGAQTGTALSLESAMDRLNAFSGTNALATTRLSATSSTLTNMLTTAQSMAQSLTEATGVGSTTTLQASAQSAMQNLVGDLNTTSGSEYIFGGINTSAQPIANYTATSPAKTAIDNAFQSYLSTNNLTASTLTSSQMQTFIDGPYTALFNDTNWQANWSSASSTTIQSNITPSQSLNTSVSANDSSIRQVTQAYAMLSEFAGGGLSSDAFSTVISSAGKLMSSGINGLNNVAGGIGVAQGTMDTATSQINAQVSVLTTNVDSLVGVDTAALSTKVTQLQTQLEASYELTSELSKLSLVNYLSA